MSSTSPSAHGADKNEDSFTEVITRHLSTSAIPASIGLTVSSLLWIPQAWYVACVINSLAAGNEADYKSLVFLVLIFGFIRAVISAASMRWAFRFARRNLSLKREKIIETLASASPMDLKKPVSGLAASVMTEQAEMLIPYLSRFQPTRIRAVLVPLAIMLVILPFSWAASAALLMTMPLVPVFMILIGWKAQKTSEEQLARMGDMNAFLLDRLRGLTTIRALDSVDITAKRLRSVAENLRKRTMAVLRIAFLTSAVLEFFSALGVAIVAVYVGFHLLGDIRFGSWGHVLTLREGLFILLLAPAFFEPLRELSAVWHDRASGEAALKALDELSYNVIMLPETSAIGKEVCPDICMKKAPSLHIRNLTFRYSPDTPLILNRFSYHIKAGEHVALLGTSGTGKTTILSLISGLAPFDEGEILFDQTPLNNETALMLRRHIAWLGQRSYIFASSLTSNVSMRRPGIEATDIKQAFEATALEKVVERHGNVTLGEGGTGLSGGEMLRLLLARAIVHPDARLLLADEPTAHLDTETAEAITDGLLHLAKGKTMIVATHDLALAERMDRIIDMQSLNGSAA